MQIGVFGGSFDPPHFGHLLSSWQLVEFGFVDQAWLMPCYAHVWRKNLAVVKDRLAMVGFLENKEIRVSTLEIEQKRALPTVETLGILKKRFPQHQFSWVIGEKSLKDLPKWKDYQNLIKNYQFLVVPQNSSFINHQSSIIKPISHPLWVTTNISSSIIRERVKKRISIKGLVPQKVAQYIQNHGLYK